MSSTLFVPIHLDALVVKSDLYALRPMADFSRLPYFNGQRDVNPNSAYLSEEIVSHPFQDQNLPLKAGVHLHWALPDALTKTMSLPIVRRQSFLSVFGTKEGKVLWDKLLAEDYKWLTKIDDSTARVVPRAERAQSGNPADFGLKLPLIEQLLAHPTFPAVPNRWLVTRHNKDGTKQSWVVESDYLFTEQELYGGNPASQTVGSITFPVEPATSTDPPYRYMGQRRDLSGWRERARSGSKNYLPDPLTAVGYGEPTFAAYYPNCHSVFGFFDNGLPQRRGGGPSINGVRYTLCGWYSDLKRDYLNQFIKDFRAHKKRDPRDKRPINLRLFEAIKEEFQWLLPVTIQKQKFIDTFGDSAATTIWNQLFSRKWLEGDVNATSATILPVGTDIRYHLGGDLIPQVKKIEKLLDVAIKEQLPDRIICHAQLVFANGAKVQQLSPDSGVAVAVGNSGTEALAAYLTDQVKAAGKPVTSVAEHLEAAQLANQLDSHVLDLGARFHEALHTKGFTAASAGSIWIVRQEAPNDQRADAQEAHKRGQITLDPALAHLLNETNQRQQAYDQALDEIESLRHQVYGDWCKYMISAYPPEDSLEEYNDTDRIKYFIEQGDIRHLNEKIATTGLLLFQRTEQGVLKKATADKAGTLAAKVAESMNKLITAIGTYNKSAANNHVSAQYVLDQVAAPRYWKPNEPVVLLAGADAKYTERHGQDGRLRSDGLLACQSPEDALPQPPKKEDDLKKFVDAFKSMPVNNGFAVSNWKNQPWHPFMLEWAVDLFPTRDPKDEQTRHIYSPTYLQHSYELPLADVELKERADATGVIVNPHPYTGFSILTPHAGRQLQSDLERELLKLVLPVLKEHFYNESIFTATAKSPALHPTDADLVGKLLPKWKSWGNKQSPKLWKKALIVDGTLAPFQQVEQWVQQNMQSITSWFLSSPKTSTEAGMTAQMLKKKRTKLTTLLNAINPDALKIEAARTDLHQASVNFSLKVLAEAYGALHNNHYLSQSLGGFNDALLGRKRTLQLPIADPLGFPNDQTFAATVQAAVLNANHSAPRPHEPFTPIRAGDMKLSALRLVDTFGRVKVASETAMSNASKTKAMTSSHTFAPIHLAPRLAQAARLNFRWLSADPMLHQPAGAAGTSSHVDDIESNAHPATSPVCGWLLPNNLDSSIMIYDHLGKPLGSLVEADTTTPWHPAPGNDLPLPVAAIDNPHLRQMVQSLVQQQLASLKQHGVTPSTSFLGHFISMLDSALEHIDPENFADHQARALLMGRPIALVRARLSVELKGLPANDQSWAALGYDLSAWEKRLEEWATQPEKAKSELPLVRRSHEFPSVTVPVRVGEYEQLNDGLVGYWIEEPSSTAPSYKGDKFYALQSNKIADAHIVTRSGSGAQDELAFNLEIAPHSPPTTLSMLVDPRGSVHATTGVLPTKQIEIPSDQYKGALEAIEVTFLTTPLLTQAEQIVISLPDEPGYAWSWLGKEHGVWNEVGTVGVLQRHDLEGQFAVAAISGDDVWRELINKGWIAPTDDDADRATVKAIDQRTKPTLEARFTPVQEKIEQLLAHTHINPFNPAATFTGTPEIREGWLKLTKTK